MQRSTLTAMAFGGILLLLGGCSKGSSDFNQGKKAEAVQDYETALAAYNRALKNDPQNPEYKLHADRMRFEAAQAHIDQGQRLREKGDLEMAVAEFRKAGEIDPSSPAADQEVQNTLALIAARTAAAATAPGAASEASPAENHLETGPPELRPLSTAPINLKMANDSKTVFETIAKLAGLTVVFDPDFTSRRITVDFDNVTLEQALFIVAQESKAFWKPLTSNVIFVTIDQTQKRRDFEDEIVQTFYIKNSIQPQDLADLVTSLRALLDLHRIQQVNSMNAIIIRDTPDKVMLAGKIIDDVDRARPEVIVEVSVLVANRDRMRDLGITPGTNITLAPNAATSTSSSSSSSGTTPSTVQATLGLNQKLQLRSQYSITLPSAAANALLTDATTRTIQNPEIRMVDGQQAKLNVGDKVPVATGSFQAGVGTSAASVVSPLVNTQFQYEEVGVALDITPRIHPDDSVTLKMSVDVSSVVNTISIGGINEPEIGEDKSEQEVRLTDGEVSVLGGLITQQQTSTVTGWPGLAKIPILRYFVADNQAQNNDDELLIVLTPHIVRLPDITPESLKSFYSGTESNPSVLMVNDTATPSATAMPPVPGTTNGIASVPSTATPAPMASAPAMSAPPMSAPNMNAGAAPPMQPTQGARIRFDPANVSLKPGETTTISVVADNVQDLYSIPLLLQYDPKVISVEAASQGGFLSGGTQEIALVTRVDKDRGQAVISATRTKAPGVSGTGTLFGIQVRAIAPGQTNLSIVQTNARDSQQHAIPLVTGESTIVVK
ncbi:MAG: cohesin domain-containing protein [Candidatus Acidiferrales bacterium]